MSRSCTAFDTRGKEAASKQEIKTGIILNGRETILVVEDEDSLREVTREYFGNNGYTVLVVLEPGAAMEAAANSTVFHVSKRPQMKTATAFPQ